MAQGNFDPAQQCLRGMHSIEASAGTGKTYSITLLWLRLLLEERLEVEQILVSTFTRAATAELQERLLAALRNAAAAATAHFKNEVPPSGPEAEIVGRCLARLGESPGRLVERLSRALSGFDLAPISTIHSFCQTLISRHALELGCDPSLTLQEDASELVEEIICDTVLAHADRQAAKVGDLRLIAKELVARPYGRLELDSEGVVPDLAEAIRQMLPGRKVRAGVRTFDDILVTVRAALDAQGAEGALAQAVRARLKAAILDECQDSDTLQISVFHTLFDHADTTSFIVIGDPKQSIYRFRGADLASYKKLAGAAKAAPQMTVNHRSDSPLIDGLNFLFGENHVFPDEVEGSSPPEEDAASGTASGGGGKTVYIAVSARHQGARITDPGLDAALVLHKSLHTERSAAERDMAGWVARECRRLLDAGVRLRDRHAETERPIRPGDIAVICARSSELRRVRRRLLGEGVPCQIAGKGLGSVYSSDEAFDVVAWLQLHAALGGAGDILNKLCALLASPLGGVPAGELLRLRESPLELSALCDEYRKIARTLERSGPLPAMLQQLSSGGMLARNIVHFEGERRVTNWRQLASLLQAAFSKGVRSAASLADWLLVRMAAPDNVEGEEGGKSDLMKLETDDSAVQFLTIHSAKGLEFPVVFCPYLWHVGSVVSAKTRTKVAVIRDADGWLLDARTADPQKNKAKSIEQQRKEEHRKLYVALTRPRHRLYVGLADVPAGTGGHKNGSKESALMQLQALKEGTEQYAAGGEARLPAGMVLLEGWGDPKPDGGAEAPAILTGASPSGLGEPPVPVRFGAPFFAIGSYSWMVKTSGEELFHTPDHDADSRRPGGDPGRGAGRVDLLAELGRGGSQLGEQLHRALEDYLGNARALAEAVSAFEKSEEWQRSLSQIVTAPLKLGNAVVTLDAVRGRCITEMQFRLPTRGLSPESLFGALLADPLVRKVQEREDWAKAVADWGFSEFYGYLQGFVDLIFEHEGRWYVVDYKSNTLAGYTSAEVEAAMLDHQYLLQSRLYCLALHRHLRQHLPGYDPARHFGGVAYLFVRGFPSGGVWFECPGLEALEALSGIFDF